MGDTHHITVTFKVDSEGFLRRRCGSCAREFKRKHPNAEHATAYGVSTIQCPYCGAVGDHGDWFTPQQVQAIKAAAVAQTPIGNALQELDRAFDDLGRAPGVQVTRRGGNLVDRFAHQDPATDESDDMRRVVLRCHGLEELKIVDDWMGAVRCTICGAPQRDDGA